MAQEKNILAELSGSKNYVKVGEIELKLDWPISIRQRFDSNSIEDYYTRKLRQEIDLHNALLISAK